MTALTEVVSKDTDYVRCGFYKTDGDASLGIVLPYKPNPDLDKTDIVNSLLLDLGWNSIWCTLIRTSIYKKGIQYTNYSMLEDMFISLQLLSESSSFSVVEEPLYNYFINLKSITKVNSIQATLDRAKGAYENVTWMIGYINRNKIDVSDDAITVLKSHPRRLLIKALVINQTYALWNSYFRELGVKPFYCKYFSRAVRFQYLLAYLRLYPVFAYVKRIIKC